MYLWQVSWWDEKGARADSEEVGHFLTGVMDPAVWYDASWITIPNSSSSAVFSKSIKIPEPISEANLAIAGIGYFRATVNGVDLHLRADPPVFLAPGWTNYKYQVPYMSFPLLN